MNKEFGKVNHLVTSEGIWTHDLSNINLLPIIFYYLMASQNQRKFLTWWWSSGQHACLLLRQSELKSRWSLQFFCKIVFEKNENKQKRDRG